MSTKKRAYDEIEKSFIESYTKSWGGLRLQERDYELLTFMLEQKFISLDMAHLRFFSEGKSFEIPPPQKLFTARQRLTKLRKNGLVKTEKVLSSAKALYLITSLGAKVLESNRGGDVAIKASKKIYFPLFDHDYMVSMIRICLELRGKCRRWYPEKWVRSFPLPLTQNGHKFGPDLFPDAVFINSKDEVVALELELSRKGQSKIKEKLRYYDELLKKGIIEKIWVVVAKDSIARAYREAIQAIYDATADSWGMGRGSKEERLKIARLRASSYRIDGYDRVIWPDLRGKK